MKPLLRVKAALHYRKVFKDCRHVCFFCRHWRKLCDYRNPYIRWI